MTDIPANPARRPARERRAPSYLNDFDRSSSSRKFADRDPARPPTNSTQLSDPPRLPDIPAIPDSDLPPVPRNPPVSVERFSSEAITKVVQYVQAGTSVLPHVIYPSRKFKRSAMHSTTASDASLSAVKPSTRVRKKKRRRVSKTGTNWADIRIPASRNPVAPTTSPPQTPQRSVVFDTTSSSEGESLSPNNPRAFLLQQVRRQRAALDDDSAALHSSPHSVAEPIYRNPRRWLFTDVDSESSSPAMPDVDAENVDTIQAQIKFADETIAAAASPTVPLENSTPICHINSKPTPNRESSLQSGLVTSLARTADPSTASMTCVEIAKSLPAPLAASNARPGYSSDAAAVLGKLDNPVVRGDGKTIVGPGRESFLSHGVATVEIAKFNPASSRKPDREQVNSSAERTAEPIVGVSAEFDAEEIITAAEKVAAMSHVKGASSSLSPRTELCGNDFAVKEGSQSPPSLDLPFSYRKDSEDPSLLTVSRSQAPSSVSLPNDQPQPQSVPVMSTEGSVRESGVQPRPDDSMEKLDTALSNPGIAGDPSLLVTLQAVSKSKTTSASLLDGQPLHSMPTLPNESGLNAIEVHSRPEGGLQEFGGRTSVRRPMRNDMSDSVPAHPDSITQPEKTTSKERNKKRLQNRTVKLWNNATSEPLSDPVSILDAEEYILQNPHCWVNPPSRTTSDILPKSFGSSAELENWMNNEANIAAVRRVMIWNPCGGIILPFAESPIVSSVIEFLVEHPELDIFSSSYLKNVGNDDQNSRRSDKRDDSEVENPESVVDAVQQIRDESLSKESTMYIDPKTTETAPSKSVKSRHLQFVNGVSGFASGTSLSKPQRIEQGADDGISNAPSEAVGGQAVQREKGVSDSILGAELSKPQREQSGDGGTSSAAIKDVFDTDDSPSPSPKLPLFKRMRPDGSDLAREPEAKRLKVSEESTDDDNTIASGLDILEAHPAPIKLPEKRDTFKLKDSSASSDSSDYLDTVEPLQAKSVPLKLRLRRKDSELSLRSGVASKTVELGTRSTNASSILLRLPLKRPDEEAPGESVYIWNMATGSKSARAVRIRDISKMCDGDSGIFVYHGQDSESWKNRCSDADAQYWIVNDDPAPRRNRKVRIWDFGNSTLLPFKTSPTVKNLESFLRGKNVAVFCERFLKRPKSQSPLAIGEGSTRSSIAGSFVSSFKPSPGHFFRAMVIHKVLVPLRRLGRPKHVYRCDERPPLWNTFTHSVVRPDRGPPKGQIVSQLIRPSTRYEIFLGQDVLLETAATQHMELVPISGNAPPNIASYWNRRRSSREEVPLDNTSTIDQILERGKLTLYVGQDWGRGDDERQRYVYTILKQAIDRYKHGGLGLYKQHFMLAYRGEEVSKLIATGWIPMVVSANTPLSEAFIFWDNLSERRFSPGDRDGLTLGEFLSRHEGLYIPYVGQDLQQRSTEELNHWFEVLKWAPGCRGCAFVPMLTKQRPCLPPKHQRRLRGKEGRNAKSVRIVQPAPEKAIDERRAKRTSEKLKASESKDAPELSRSRNESELKEVDDAEVVTDEEDVYREKFKGFLISKMLSEELHSLNSKSPVLVRNKPTGLILPQEQSPTLETLASFLTENIDYEIYDRYSCSSAEETEGTSLTAVSDADVFIRAKLAGQREANRLQCVVPEILKATRIGDPLQKVKEELEEELSTCGQFGKLIAKLRCGEFVALADKLLEHLESLDVFNFYTEEGDNVFGTPDILSIRDDLQLGSSFLVHDVIKAFRENCSAAIQYNPANTILHEEIVLLYHQGEQVISSFFDDNLESMRADLAVFKILELTVKALKQSDESKSTKTKTAEDPLRHIVHRSSPGKILQRNPYLNYRDEAGYSLMGKPHSAKVLGLLIDEDQSCLKDIERMHWAVDTSCHLCSKPIADVYSNSLPCANRIFGTCQRIVCRGCWQRNQKVDANAFVIMRASGSWHCLHCTGICRKQKRACSKHDPPQPDPVVREISFVVDTRDIRDNTSVTAVFARCQQNGEFEEFQDDKQVSGASDGKGVWRCRTKLAVGGYRVKIFAKDKWIASSILHVFPVARTRKRPAEAQLDRADDAVRFSKADWNPYRRYRAPKVEWEEGTSTGEGNVVSLRSGPIRESSRTEGYNWSSSKRHKITRWRPKIDGCIPPQIPTIVTTNAVPFLPEEDVHSGGESVGLFTKIMVKKKKSYAEFSKELMASKYDKMLKHSLWGLVVCRSMIHGSGLFTVSGYGKGDLIVEYAGDLIRTPIADLREARYEAAGLGTYLFKVNEHQIVDATVRSNRARFVNHCCDPNMAAEIISVRGRDLVVLRAIRPIPPFAELTFDYQLPLEDKKLQCQCKSWNCIGVMN